MQSTTGGFTDWTGNLLDIGPIYPFPGSERVLVVILLVFWVGWHLLQIGMESSWLRREAQRLRQTGELDQAVQREQARERL